MRLRYAVILCTLLGACTEHKTVREWRPEDHSPPEENADPSRVAASPSGDTLARAAAALFRVSCASCHGPDGLGDGPAKPAGAAMASFRDPAWQAARSDEEIANTIRVGKNLMPKFGDQINPQGVTALVAHIRSLARAPE